MAQNIENRKWLFDELSKNGYELGNFDQFNEGMNDEETQKWAYDESVKLGYEMGSIDDFKNGMAIDNPAQVNNAISKKVQKVDDSDQTSQANVSQEIKKTPESNSSTISDSAPKSPQIDFYKQGKMMSEGDEMMPYGKAYNPTPSKNDNNKALMDDFEEMSNVSNSISMLENARLAARGKITGNKYVDIDGKRIDTSDKDSYLEARKSLNERIESIQERIDRNPEYTVIRNETTNAVGQMKKDFEVRHSQRMAELGARFNPSALPKDASMNDRYKFEAEKKFAYENEEKNYSAASAMYDDAQKILQAPMKFDGENGAGAYLSKMFAGAKDNVTDKDFWTLGISEVKDNAAVFRVLKKLQDNNVNLNEALSDKNGTFVDKDGKNILTPSEEELLDSYITLQSARALRANDVAGAYNAGQIVADSVALMVGMGATKGVANASMKAIRNVMNKAIAKKLTGMSSRAGRAIIKNAYGMGDKLFTEAIASVAASPLTPLTWNAVIERNMQVGEDGKLSLSAKNFASGMLDGAAEYFTERSGGIFNKAFSNIAKVTGVSNVFKIASKADGKIFDMMRKVGKIGIPKAMKNAAFDGILGEMGEEEMNAVIDRFRGDENALRDFNTWDNLFDMGMGFAVPSAFGMGITTYNVASASRDIANKQESMRNVLSNLRFDGKKLSDDAIDQIIDNFRASYIQRPDGTIDIEGSKDSEGLNQLKNYLSLIMAMADDGSIRGAVEGLFKISEDSGIGRRKALYKVMSDYLNSCARYQAISGLYNGKQDERLETERKSLSDETSGVKFWGVSKEGNVERKIIEIATTKDGRNWYVTADYVDGIPQMTEDGKMPAVSMDGKEMSFISNDDIAETTDEIGNVAKVPTQVFDSMEEYLNYRLVTNGTIDADEAEETSEELAKEEQKQLESSVAEAENGDKKPILKESEARTKYQKLLGDENGIDTPDGHGIVSGVDDNGLSVALDSGVENTYPWSDVSAWNDEAAEEETPQYNQVEKKETDAPKEDESANVPESNVSQNNTEESKNPDFKSMLENNPSEFYTSFASVFGRDEARKELEKRLSELRKQFDEADLNDKIDIKRRIDAISSAMESTKPVIGTSEQEQSGQVEQKKDVPTWTNAKDEERRKAQEKADEDFHLIVERWDSAKKFAGKPTARMIGNRKISGKYVLVEADAVTASHDPNNNMEPSKGFPMVDGMSANSRDYTNPQTKATTELDAGHFNGNAIDKVPMVTNDGVVVDGNGRTIMSQIAAKNGTDSEYLDYLNVRAEELGFTPEQIAELKHPRVYFLIDQGENIEYTVSSFHQFNAGNSKTESKSEQAQRDSRILSEPKNERFKNNILEKVSEFDTIAKVAGSSSASQFIVKNMISAGILTQYDVPKMIAQKDGTGTKEFQEKLENTLLGLAFDKETLNMLIDYDYEHSSSVKSAITRCCAQIAKSNSFPDEYKLGNRISDALNLIYNAIKFASAQNIFGKEGYDMFDDLLHDESSLFDADVRYNGLTEMLARFIWDYHNNRGKTIADTFDAYNSVVEKYVEEEGQESMFPGQELQKKPIEELIKNAIFEDKTYKSNGQEGNSEKGGVDSAEIPEGTIDESGSDTVGSDKADDGEGLSGTEKKEGAKPGDGAEVEKGANAEAADTENIEEPKKKEFGSDNKYFTKDLLDEALKDLQSELNFGYNPKLAKARFVVAGFVVEAGARKIADFVNMVREVAKEALFEKLIPYLESMYESVRMDPDTAEYKNELSSTEEVKKYLHETFPETFSKPENVAVENVAASDVRADALNALGIGNGKTDNQSEASFFPLSSVVMKKIYEAVKNPDSEKPYKSIVDLRKEAKLAGLDVSNNGSDDIKIQEAVEFALINVCRRIIKDCKEEYGTDWKEAAFDGIVRVYEMQPTISMRDNNRIELQQYSTPLPMAFLADMFAAGESYDYDEVFEPTAGNGFLTMMFDHAKTYVNEIDKTRLNNLRHLGFARVTDKDARNPFGEEKRFDVVVANPPFGSAEGKEYDGKIISGLDPQITLNALESMKDSGRAAIIIGGNIEYSDNGAIKTKRQFFTYLYDHYNVKAVVPMSGNLYAKQGTTYPTMMILIEGRRSEQERALKKVYPPIKENAPTLVESYNDLYITINNYLTSKSKTDGSEIDNEVVLGSRTANGASNGRPSGNPVVAGHNAESLQDRTDKGESKSGSGGRTGNDSENVANGKTDSGEVNDGGNGPISVVQGEGDANGQLLPGRASGTDRTGTDSYKGEVGTERDGDGGNAGNVSGRPSGADVEGADVERGNLAAESSGQNVKKNGAQEERTLDTKIMHYQPKSEGEEIGSFAPAGMVHSMHTALERVAEKHGDIDEWVRKELGYDTKQDLYNSLASEQIDGVAEAIYQMENGQSLIIGDQTGMGKGRQMAALIRYARQKGKRPVFITHDKELINDIYRDLCDIGCENFNPLIINNDAKQKKFITVNGENKEIAAHKHPTDEKFKKIIKSGEIPSEYDYVVLSYHQLNKGDEVSDKLKGVSDENSSKKGKRPKPEYIRKIVEGNYLFMDESHTAAGEGNTGYFIRSIIPTAFGVTFSSATFAKTPDTMPIYALKTAMSKSDIEPEEMIQAIKNGGSVLQEIMSRALTDVGQMFRRERGTFGVVTDWITIDKPEIKKMAREKYSRAIAVFRDIIEFQNDYIKPRIEEISENIAIMAGTANVTKGTNNAGVDNPPFVNTLYSFVKSLLLAIKTDAVVDTCVEQIKQGRHPVIALENTMESMLSDFNVGDIVEEPTFAISLRRKFDNVLKYTITDEDGEKTNYKFDVSTLGEETGRAYNDILQKISEATSDIFISPVDAITSKLESMGYKVGEISGRKTRIVYTENGDAKIVAIPEISRSRKIFDFNSGNTDVIIINKAGCTGISLHSSVKFKDQRQRVMIMAQPLSDINDYMQMIGRIDRTGQIHRGYYINLNLPIPAENRIAMMLAAKLRSLNANTTTSQESESDNKDAVDFLNKYGTSVAREYFIDNPDMYVKMGEPFGSEKDPVTVADLETHIPSDDKISRVTSRAALLSVDDQELFYNEMASRYSQLIDYLDSVGENDLKIETIPLNAVEISKVVAENGVAPESDNPFAQDTYLETLEVDVIRKPMTAEMVKATIENISGSENPKERTERIIKLIDEQTLSKLENNDKEKENAIEAAKEKIARRSAAIIEKKKASEEEKLAEIAEFEKKTYDDIDSRFERNADSISILPESLKSRIGKFDVGSTYLIPESLAENVLTFKLTPAILCGYKFKEENITPSTTIAVFAVLDGRRKIEVKMSNSYAITRIKDLTNLNIHRAERVNLENWDSEAPTQARKTVRVLTGNILLAVRNATDATGKMAGKLISFTYSDGTIKDGLLLPDGFDTNNLRSAGKPINMAKDELINTGKIESTDGKVTVDYGRRYASQFTVYVPKSKKDGLKFYSNPELLSLSLYGRFFEKGGRMNSKFSKGNVEKVLDVLAGLGVKVKESDETSNNRFSSIEDEAERINHLSDTSEAGKIEKVRSISENLGLDVDVYTSLDDVPKGRKRNSYGWYNTNTGKISIVLPNCKNVEVVEAKMLHEAVAHKGLRELYREDFDTAMSNIYDNLSENGKKIVDGMIESGRVKDIVEGVEEYAATIEERGPMSDEEYSIWSKVRAWIVDAIRKLGFRLNLTEQDIRGILYDAKRKLENAKSPIGASVAIVTSERLKEDAVKSHEPSDNDGGPDGNGGVVSNDSEINEEIDVEDSLRFSSVFDAVDKNPYPKELDAVNIAANHWWNRTVESAFDNLVVLKETLRILADITGKPMATGEDASKIMNHSASRFADEKDRYTRKLLNPLLSLRAKILKDSKIEDRDLTKYLSLKNGLERQIVFAKRDASDAVEAKRNAAISNERKSFEEEAKKLKERLDSYLNFEGGDSKLTGEEITEEQYTEELNAAKERLAKKIDKINSRYDSELKRIKIGDESQADYKKARQNDYGAIRTWFATYSDPVTKVEYAEMPERLDGESRQAYNNRLHRMMKFADDNIPDAEIRAQNEVKRLEGIIGTENVKELWNEIRKNTDYIVEMQYQHGIITKELHDKIVGNGDGGSRMFEYYVPMRGFAEDTAADLYDYNEGVRGSVYEKPFIKAKGRITEPESPFSHIAAMHDVASSASFRNDAFNALRKFIANRKEQKAVTVLKVWYVKTEEDGKEVQKPVTAPIDPSMSVDEMNRTMKEFEDEMKELKKQGKASEKKMPLDMHSSVVNIGKDEAPQHIVKGRYLGRDVEIVFNGDPRAAQEFNGVLNMEKSIEGLLVLWNDALRFFSKSNTSARFAFGMATNIQRDLVHSMMNTFINESPKFIATFAEMLPVSFSVIPFYLAGEKARGIDDSRILKYFDEYMSNGAPTGVAYVQNHEEYDKIMDRRLDRDLVVDKKTRDILKAIPNTLFRFNEAFEQISRFATYMTARKLGMSVEDSIAKAKNVTINFSQRGTYKPITFEDTKMLGNSKGKPVGYPKRFLAWALSNAASFGNGIFPYFNAILQAIYQQLNNARNHTARTAIVASSMILLGYVLNYTLAFDDDDDNEELWKSYDDETREKKLKEKRMREDRRKLGKYQRQNKVVTNRLDFLDGMAIQWAMPQEWVPFIAMGDGIAQARLGNKSVEEAIKESIEAFSNEYVPVSLQMLRHNLFIGSTVLDIARNENFQGLPVYWDNPYKENIPEFRKATNQTWQWLVDACEYLNYKSGGDYTYPGTANFNPAIIQHAIVGVLGGSVQDVARYYDIIKKKNNPLKNVEANDWPIKGKYVYDYDAPWVDRALREQYDYYSKRAKIAADAMSESRHNNYYSKVYDSKDAEYAVIYAMFDDAISARNEMIKAAQERNASDDELKELYRDRDEIRRGFVEACKGARFGKD